MLSVSTNRTKPVSPKPRVKHLTSKEMSAAMRALTNKNKKVRLLFNVVEFCFLNFLMLDIVIEASN